MSIFNVVLQAACVSKCVYAALWEMYVLVKSSKCIL